MRVIRVRTETDSIYLIGPSPDRPDRIRLARVSDHAVRGTLGPIIDVAFDALLTPIKDLLTPR